MLAWPRCMLVSVISVLGVQRRTQQSLPSKAETNVCQTASIYFVACLHSLRVPAPRSPNPACIDGRHVTGSVLASKDATNRITLRYDA